MEKIRRHFASLACLALTLAATSASGQTLYDFSIPPQPLESALIDFARVTGIELGIDPSEERRRTAGLEGRFSIDEGLSRLLEGTGTAFTRIAPRAYRVRESEAAATPPTDTEEERPAPGFRQPALSAFDAEQAPQRREEIVTVGTRIHQSGYRVLQPVTTLGGNLAAEAGVYAAGDLFDFLPLSGANNFNGVDNYFYGVNDARGDVATANLRGLGSGNSLVLLNGRRIVNHPATQQESRILATTVNLNSLPLFALERIDVLHDSASSVHGSDAVAGVVNAVLVNDPERTRVGLVHGVAEDRGMTRTNAHLQVSRPVGERSQVALFAEFSDQDGLAATDRSISYSSDLRPFFAGTPYAGDADLDNRSRSSSWGQFKLPQAVSMNGSPVTSPTGVLHLQPAALPGCTAAIDDTLCVDDGLLDNSLRSDNNRYRFLAPSVDRVNLFSMWSAGLSDAVELYGEAGWYRARTRHTRAPASPLASHPITIPRDNYWNPFGPVTFDDGRPNPNRLPGIDAPPEGLPLTINTRAEGGYYRVVDAGPRIINVENRVDRLLVGARAWVNDWHMDTAYLYSHASTEDVTNNRISNTLFQDALSLSTAEAYNPFNGGDPADPGFGDATPNPAAVIDTFLIDVERRNTASLELWDFTLSNPNALQLDGRPVGFSIGGEVRRESFGERRDPRLNGEVGYTDRVTGISYASDVMQSSITPDSRGSRTVRSLFAEAALALVDEAQGVPFVRRLDANLAMRLESYSDIGTEWRPRIGLAWWLDERWGVHASWSEGLRAPNLPQVNSAPVPRIQVVRDWYRCQALVNKGVVGTLGECDIEASRSVEVTTSGSAALKAETNRSYSVGLRFQHTGDHGLTFSADYWDIEQRDVVDIFGDENHVALDYFLRLEGSANAAVSRSEVRPEDLLLFAGSGLEPVGLLQRVDDPYLNLDRQMTRGIDLAFGYQSAPARFGTLSADLLTTRLLTATQSVPDAGRKIVDAGVPAVPFVGAGDLIERNGRPKWRASLRLAVERDNTDFGLVANYVGEIVDTSAIQDETNAFLPVDSWGTVTAFAGVRLNLFGDKDATLRLSIGNLFDEPPPIADEDLAYFVGLHDAAGRTWNLSLTADM